jgi:hypothetical protein
LEVLLAVLGLDDASDLDYRGYREDEVPDMTLVRQERGVHGSRQLRKQTKYWATPGSLSSPVNVVPKLFSSVVLKLHENLAVGGPAPRVRRAR